jgi:hypothetical protein
MEAIIKMAAPAKHKEGHGYRSLLRAKFSVEARGEIPCSSFFEAIKCFLTTTKNS